MLLLLLAILAILALGMGVFVVKWLLIVAAVLALLFVISAFTGGLNRGGSRI